ncbi:hypothetical protein [Actinoplanes sp. NBRC 103695]|uniref:hypothetical protein n=1 Tax=Actinoplanes sp. NBRC 103695 TaxID=3032202 RepID=UPI0024A4C1FD|nr:hypothetical protein [Actinoplanes sp. NBRC 103695]GLZ00832.1 hypothetical protein Acsp02_80840 [Actinoplanes sp. NBRC 103695]
MTMPAEVTSDNAWDRLTTVLRAMYRDVDELYERITDSEADEPSPQPEETEPVSDLDAEYDTEAHDRAAEYADEERERLDAETDGRLDGDYDTDVYDNPGLED